MKIEKRKSGSYRVRKMHEGKVINLTFDHKPTNKEILSALAEKISCREAEEIKTMTFRQAATKYVDMKKNVLSANTLREYTNTPNRLPTWFVDMNIYDIDQISINKVVNELSVDKSPKTVHNYHAFLTAILGTFRPDMKIYTTLPQKRSHEPYIPTESDVKTILKHEEGTEYYIPYVLACYGMRRGEILAAGPGDLEKKKDCYILHITKAIALDTEKNWITKTTKTAESVRDINIPLNIGDMIIKQGYIYNGHPNTLTCHLDDVLKELNIPHFSLHKFRHYFASVLIEKGVPIPDVMYLGGWKSDTVLRKIYTHSMLKKKEDEKRKIMNTLSTSIF